MKRLGVVLGGAALSALRLQAKQKQGFSRRGTSVPQGLNSFIKSLSQR
jgi:hypothetical protein